MKRLALLIIIVPILLFAEWEMKGWEPDYVPYEDAKKDVNLGSKTFRAGYGYFKYQLEIDSLLYASTPTAGYAKYNANNGFGQLILGQLGNSSVLNLYNAGYWAIQAKTTYNEGFVIKVNNATVASFRKDTTVEFNDDVKIDGNVGIGTTNPSSKLDVNGNGHFSGNVTVDKKVNDYIELDSIIIHSAVGPIRYGNIQGPLVYYDDHTYRGSDLRCENCYDVWTIHRYLGRFDSLTITEVKLKFYGTFNDSDTIIVRIDTLNYNNLNSSYFFTADTFALSSGSGWHYETISCNYKSIDFIWYGNQADRYWFIIRHKGAGSGNPINLIYMKVIYRMWR